MSDPCEEALHELYHFLDGELTETRRELISVHLDTCTSCRAASGDAARRGMAGNPTVG
jgi:predicted anti-sigma-YlaC factor YlaD